MANASDILANIGSAVRPDNGYSVPATSQHYDVLLEVFGDEALIKPTGSSARKIFPIRAHLPERFHMELSSQWGQPFAQASAGGAADGLVAGSGQFVDAALGAAGIGNKTKSQHVHVWESTSPLQMNLDLVFYANENTEREVKERQLALLKLAAPTSEGEVLKAPGPRLINNQPNGATEGRRIAVYIGSYLYFESVVITSVGTDVVTLLDENGIPIAMTINLGFMTYNGCITGEDLEKIFYAGQSWPSS